MNPKKLSAFIFSVLLAMLLLTLLSRSLGNESGIEKTGFPIGGTSLKYPSLEYFLNADVTLENKDQIDSILHNVEPIVEEIIEEKTEEIIEPIVLDEKEKVPGKISKVFDISVTDTTKIVRISYPDSRDQFVTTLLEQLKSPQCRIVHYGDSQLEGDRISAYIRNRLQSVFGGSGPGFIPIKQAYEQISAKVTPSENWLRYAAFDPTQEKFHHKKYGLFTSVSRFTPYVNPNDTIAPPEPTIQKATISIKPSKMLYSKLGSYTNIGLHYGNCNQPTSLKVYREGALIRSENLLEDGAYHQVLLEFATTPTEIIIEFEGIESPDFYGITLDGAQGISLDNVAMRGASGTIFVKQDRAVFNQMTARLNPKIFIFQYGGNTIPYLRSEKGVDDYLDYLMSNVKWVRRSNPDATVLFIGPSDMSTSVNGSMMTYPLLSHMNQRLKEVCLKNNIAYWSLFEAMGGENSMPYWVEQKLAGSDYTHFTASGNRIVSELFFTALQLDLMKKL